MKNNLFLKIAVLSGAVACCISGGASGSVVDLGAASGYSVLGLNNTNVFLSNVTVNGDVGVSPQGTLTLMAPSTVTGTIFVDVTASIGSSAGTATGGINHTVNLASAVNDAISASLFASSLSATQTVSGISSALTLQGNGGITVLDVNGGISLNNQNITLNGSANDKFVLNISGNLSMGGTASIVLGGGVTAGNVLLNFDGTNQTINTHVGDVVNATILAPTANGLTLDGKFYQIIAGGPNITLMSGAQVGGLTSIPEANSGLVMIPFVLGMLALALKKMLPAKDDESVLAESRA